MQHRIGRGGLAYLLLTAISVLLLVAGCGSGSPDARKLLRQTFTGPHSVQSGSLSFTLTVSRSRTGTVGLSLSGLFQSAGSGKLPASNFILGVSAPGRGASVRLVSTGSAGYVTLPGASYKLPVATLQRLESSFAHLTASPAAGRPGELSPLGLNPLHWIVKPAVAGKEKMGGVETTHVRAAINVQALRTELGTLLEEVTAPGPRGMAPVPRLGSGTAASRSEPQFEAPRLDVWTGTRDKTLRKLALRLMLPAAGRAAIGRQSSTQVALTMRYANLNQTQTIAAPASLRPLAELTPKLQAFVTELESALTQARLGLS